MTKNALHNQIIQNRLKLILQLIAEGQDPGRIEREVAVLALDVVDAIGKAALPGREGGKCFLKIEYALDQKIRNRLGQEFEDIVNEGMLLDELHTRYGADLNLLVRLATKILARKTVVDKKAVVRVPVAVR